VESLQTYKVFAKTFNYKTLTKPYRFLTETLNNNKMNQLKKIMGFVWMLIAPIVIFFLINGAMQNIGNGTKDINKPIPWIIIITIFIPICIGLMIFGYYAVKGEYEKEY
jgi:purine-cytosine permease-like protein